MSPVCLHDPYALSVNTVFSLKLAVKMPTVLPETTGLNVLVLLTFWAKPEADVTLNVLDTMNARIPR